MVADRKKTDSWQRFGAIGSKLGGKCRRRSDAGRRAGRFQERFRLTRKSKIVKSNFFESFDVFSGLPCLFLPVLSFLADAVRLDSVDRRRLSRSLSLFLSSLFPLILPGVSVTPSRLFLLPFYPVSCSARLARSIFGGPLMQLGRVPLGGI